MPTPTLISRQQGEAWKRPFIAVYEPFDGKNNYTVERIENIDRSDAGNFTALEVFSKNESRQIILQSINADKIHEQKDWKFKGSFAVISIKENNPTYLYLGEGSQLSYQDYAIQANALNGSANLLIERNKLRLSCNQQTTISINNASIKKLTLIEKSARKNLPLRKKGSEVSFTVPATMNAEIQIN
jgi:hypothetical protein